MGWFLWNPFSPSVIDSQDSSAQQFTSGISTDLVSITVSLGQLNSGNNGDFALTARLIEVMNAGDAPDMGSVVATLSQIGSIPTSGFSNVEFDPSGSVSLDASKFYWFALTGASSDPTGGVSWQFSDTTTTSGPGTLPAYGFDVPGQAWSLFPVNPRDESTYPFLIEVIGQGPSVPEPSSLILGCIGLSAALFGRAWTSKRCRSVA